MLTVWTFLKGAFSFIVKNWGWIATAAMLLFIVLFFDQCKAKKIAREETAEAKLIADNNLKALKDSTIVLKVTRDQLKIVDQNLAKVTHDLDSVKKNPQIVYIAKPVYLPKDVTVNNQLIKDKNDSTRYGLKFYSFDSVRTISAISWFKAVNTPTKLLLTPSNTVIDHFSLNFGLVIAQYDMPKEKITRLSIEPYFVDSSGNYTKPISKNLLNVQYRGVNLLDVPYKLPDCPSTVTSYKHKYSVKSGFTLSVNLIGYGYTPFASKPERTWILPSVGIGYGLMLLRNK